MEKQESSVETSAYEELLWRRRKVTSNREKIEYILRLYVLLGLGISLAGAGYFVITTLNIELSGPQQTALLATVSGAALSIASAFLLKFRRQRFEEEFKKIQLAEYLGEFVHAFAQFETVARDALVAHGESFNRYSIRQMIEMIRSDEALEDQDILLLQEALQVRNAVLHGGEHFPPEFLVKHTEALIDLSHKVRRHYETRAKSR